MQKFLEVYRNGVLWFEFPAENEQNVRARLIKDGVDRTCVIQPKVDTKLVAEKINAKLINKNLSNGKSDPS